MSLSDSRYPVMLVLVSALMSAINMSDSLKYKERIPGMLFSYATVTFTGYALFILVVPSLLYYGFLDDVPPPGPEPTRDPVLHSLEEEAYCLEDSPEVIALREHYTAAIHRERDAIHEHRDRTEDYSEAVSQKGLVLLLCMTVSAVVLIIPNLFLIRE